MNRLMTVTRTKNKLGQYFTPQQICEFMVSLTSKPPTASVLEPSSGQGAFLEALHSAGFSKVRGVEIDSDIAFNDHFPVENSSFITWETDEQFDLVIGNPPYIRWKDLEAEQKDELREHRYFGSMVNSLSDYLLPFIALSIEKLKPEGELIFITPSFWLQTKHSQGLRDYLDSQGQVTDLIDFGENKIFKDVATSLIIFKFVKTSSHRETKLHRFIGSKINELDLDLHNPTQFRSEIASHFHSKGKYVPAFDAEVVGPLILESECEIPSILGKQFPHIVKMGDVVHIANGMVTGLDAAFKLTNEFVETLPKEELSGISKVVKGKNLDRLYSPGFSHYIDINPELSDQQVEENYPTLLNHLMPYKTQLLKRYVNGTELKWWQWAFYRSGNFHRSTSPKGFVPGKERLTHKSHVRFTMASGGCIATQDVTAFAPHQATSESLEYIVAFLNLDVVSDWVRSFGLMKGGVAEFSEKPLSEIPFRRIDWSNPDEVAIHEAIVAIMRATISSKLTVVDAQLQLTNQFEKLMPALFSSR